MTLPNYDYDSENEALLRRQKIAEAMQAGGLAPMGPTEYAAGGVAVKRSPLEGLNKVLQAYAGKMQQEKIGEERAMLGNRYKADMKSGLERLLDGLSAQPGTVPAVQGNNPSAYVPEQQQSAADVTAIKRKAILEAVASNHPVLQQLGTSQLQSLQKDRLTPKDVLSHATPASVAEMVRTNDVSGFRPKLELKEVGGIIYDPADMTIKELKANAPAKVKIDGDLYEVNPSTKQLKKLDNAPKVTVTNNNTTVNKGETKFMEKLGSDSAEDIIKTKQAKVDAQRTIQSMQKLEQLEKTGVYSGPTAKPAMVVGSLAEAMGIPVDKQKLGTSQAYEGELMSNLSNVLTGSLARSTTDKDVQILMAPLPQLLNSPEGRAALRRQAVAKAQERIEYADSVQNQILTNFPEARRLIMQTPGTVPIPQRSDVPRGGAGGKPSVSNW